MKAGSTVATSAQDAFMPAMECAAEMAKYLGSGNAFGATHSELERYAEREGREFVRRMLQGHYDLRAIAERPVRARRGSRPRRALLPAAEYTAAPHSRSPDASMWHDSRSRRARLTGFTRWTPC